MSWLPFRMAASPSFIVSDTNVFLLAYSYTHIIYTYICVYTIHIETDFENIAMLLCLLIFPTVGSDRERFVYSPFNPIVMLSPITDSDDEWDNCFSEIIDNLHKNIPHDVLVVMFNHYRKPGSHQTSDSVLHIFLI